MHAGTLVFAQLMEFLPRHEFHSCVRRYGGDLRPRGFSFGATGDSLSAGKKLLDTRHPAYRTVSAVRGRIQFIWKARSLPYPKPAIRLIRRDEIERLDTELSALRGELANAVEQLDHRYAELRTAVQQRLGRLFNLSDYPASLCSMPSQPTL